ncbi:outer membrane beta-barrel protein [Vibrio sp. D404a]|uniref:porin family protein n=1 Tax=unclassified Vibrio TaxID=2614977 RepID=UPI002554D8F5|nr:MULTISPECIES: porin family protein [unclassified Vibrio]MDK9738241.1 outer membrane beta-barrel protein [Vibrio sp. D404a]MDK9796532.1 outer membrane beta-barrel protein [Vibrio sp. D449a]
MKSHLLIAVGLLSFNAHAYESPFYLGAGIGETDFDDGGASESALIPISSDTDGQTYKLFGGFRLNQHIGFEGQYTRYADTVYRSPVQKGKGTVELASYSLAANVGYQFDMGLRPFVTVGLGMMDFTSKGPAGSYEDQEVLVRLGGGVEYTHPALRRVTFRLAYEKDDFDVSSHGQSTSLGVASVYLGTSVNF